MTLTKVKVKPTTAAVQEAGGSMNDYVSRLTTAWSNYRRDKPGAYSWVVDVFEGYVVVKWGGYSDESQRYYEAAYTITDDAVTFAPESEWVAVQLSYAPVGEPESTEEASDVMESIRGLVEATDKGPEAVIVVEGLSANGNHYTKEALDSGVDVFSGRQVYIDHPKKSDETERPERSIRDLAGVLGEAYIGKDKMGRKALRAPLKLSETVGWLKTMISEGIVSDMSIRANGKGKRNQQGHFVVESFVDYPHTSLDFVTVASAGGAVELSESVRGSLFDTLTKEALLRHRPDLAEELQESSGEGEVQRLQESASSSEFAELKEAHAQLLEEAGRMFEQLRTGEAEALMEGLLNQPLPKATKQKLWETAAPLMEAYATHGSQTSAAQLKAAFQKLIEAEKKYLSTLIPNGVVRGFTAQTSQEAVEDILKEAFTGLVPDEQVSIAVKGRS